LPNIKKHFILHSFTIDFKWTLNGFKFLLVNQKMEEEGRRSEVEGRRSDIKGTKTVNAENRCVRLFSEL
jgi:hypothetical protein